jgi:Ca2+-binding RTX toxin-like protein
MTNLRKLALTLVLMLGVAQSAAAQTSCPASTSSDISFVPWGGGTVLTRSHLASAAHTIYLGTTNYLGTDMSIALITNQTTGYCTVYFMSFDGGATTKLSLTQNANLCLGNYSDSVFVIHENDDPTPSCGGTTVLDPFMYNGSRLNIYARNGDDKVHAGSGRDYIYGGNGDDDLTDAGGSSDRMYGETNNDDLVCSDGPSTRCEGGGAPDVIEDLAGDNDTITGGGSTDLITACGVKTVDCGESSPGYSDSDILWYDYTNGSSSLDCETVHLNVDCF